MFKNLWKSIRNEDYIEFLREELEKVRLEKNALQDTLHHVLKIHLIPKDRNEMQAVTPQPIPISRTRNMRTFLSDQQKKSYDEAVRKQIEQAEKQIEEVEDDIKDLESREVINDADRTF